MFGKKMLPWEHNAVGAQESDRKFFGSEYNLPSSKDNLTSWHVQGQLDGYEEGKRESLMHRKANLYLIASVTSVVCAVACLWRGLSTADQNQFLQEEIAAQKEHETLLDRELVLERTRRTALASSQVETLINLGRQRRVYEATFHKYAATSASMGEYLESTRYTSHYLSELQSAGLKTESYYSNRLADAQTSIVRLLRHQSTVKMWFGGMGLVLVMYAGFL